MSFRCALALACFATVTSPVMSHAARIPEPRCTEGTWTIDGGPATIGPFEIHTLAITAGVPSVTPFCRAQRWALQRTGELRVLFACRDPDGGLRPRFPLRLRVLLSDACSHVDGAFVIRRMNAIVRFTASKTGGACTSNDDCTPEAFCQHPLGQCTAEGRCAVRPWSCFGVFKPSCGCDGRSHLSCEAAQAGISIASIEPCTTACGGVTGTACPDGEFCELPAGTCGSADLEGACVATGDACPEYYSPVCGCDGVTYANDCFRQAASAQKAHDGACGDDCTSNDQCAGTAYCAKPPGTCEGHGRCTTRPLGCPDNVDPVCGCNGTTYSNACDAAAVGTNVARAGECAKSCGGFIGIPCPENQFCDLPAGQCGGADLEGHCVPTDGACPEIYLPVCGCDGVTYANDCFRQAAGAQKASDGACECLPVCCPPGSTGVDTNQDGCADTCSAVLIACPVVDGRPICPWLCETACDCYASLTPFCFDCPLLCPSCGEFWQCKDGFCVEQCGALPPDVSSCAQDICGGITGLLCPQGKVCQFSLFGGCEADAVGQCVAITSCTQQYDPVCGCDGKTYGNDCERSNAGVQRAHFGAC
jgi:hypothetical protein